ncbi:ornithine carbamoyltransferase [Saccharomycopsis crataegensis]|uniref:ornithine carbamoyltransferase n=1 Tax=Saccharomycopsis crataegensis TaxID=43959 RepID=A0AAV5QLS8_9ASCO|nr:ornithine carbamoyltransferase [Saccharomycopsis crataegensis]
MSSTFIRMLSNTSAKPIRHLVSISELSHTELHSLVNRAAHYKSLVKSNTLPPDNLADALKTQTVGLLFSKRSTRTRISSEAAVNYFGGHPLFLGSQDIQLGVNESFYDSIKVISSMTGAIFARVNSHDEIQQLVKHSSVPVINSLCDTYHPLQAICDMLTIKEQFNGDVKGKKLTWVGDANNVINDLAVAAAQFGMNVSVAIPQGYKFDEQVAAVATKVASEQGCKFEVVHDPLVAVKDANIVVTDTFVSMGEESQTKQKLETFKGFQVSKELIEQGQVAKDWRFMHCLPRHEYEVSDEIFYGENSVVFEEAENRLYAAIAVLEALVVNKGKFL